MNTLIELECDLLELESFANTLSIKADVGNIFLIRGDLGVGKTTFARFFINSLYNQYKVTKPEIIKSPSYPIVINYPLLQYEIYHYDLYRLKNKNELSEIGLFENLENNISIIEWPEMIINNFNLNNFYLLDLKFINSNKRKIKLQYFNSNVT